MGYGPVRRYVNELALIESVAHEAHYEAHYYSIAQSIIHNVV